MRFRKILAYEILRWILEELPMLQTLMGLL